MPDLAAALAYRGAARLRLDPRTALAALLVVNVISLSVGFSGPSLWARVVVSLVPILLLLAQRRPVAALVCVAATALALLTESVGLSALTGAQFAGRAGWVLSAGLFIVGALANLLARFVPVVLMAWYVITTVRAGQLMGALGQLRVPRAITIPLAVVLRMVPVLAAESSAISQAARTRGLRGLIRPKAFIDYRIVPLTLRTVDIGDELTQAGFTRGLEARGPRTCYGQIGFGWVDAAVLALCVAAIAILLVGWL